MSGAYGPTVAKRRLSRRLQEIRARTTLTANSVCDRLSWGRGKVGRIEGNSWKRPEMSDVRDLLRFYQVGDEECRELEELAMLARQRAWWREYGDLFGDSEFPGFEEDAVRIGCYTPLVLPGLLQTPDCTEAHLKVSVHSPEWRERALRVRALRQEILTRDDGTAPRLVAVITEASLRYRWGTFAQRRAQVEHLQEVSRRPHVELRLLRFEDGLHPGMCGPIHIFEFAGAEPPAVFLETDFAVQEVDIRSDVGAYMETFARICRVALDPFATGAYLEKLAQTLR